MKLLLFILAFSGTAISSSIDFDATENETLKSGKVSKLLFVGNSLTYSNNLPKLVETKAREQGIMLETTMLAKPNYAIVDHWADGTVQELIKSKQYDYVIIQQGPSSQQDGYDMLVNAGKQYSNLCKANGAELVYFMVWPSRKYYHTFNRVIANYTAGAEANDAILSPVGKVWKEHFDRTGDFSYYGPDRFHPSLKGSQVAADVIINSLFPTGSVPDNKRQAWLTGIGNIENNGIHVDELYLTENGAFGDQFNPEDIHSVLWGNLNIEFTDCHNAEMSYSSHVSHRGNAFGSGAYPLTRLAMNEAGKICEEFGFDNRIDDAFFSGTFFGGVSRNGEGFNIDYLNQQQVLVSWFTYLPSD